MTHRYSKEVLRCLRNDIPIQFVIETLLNIPVKYTEGVYRFLCPLCGEFVTGVKPETNLARCFRCERNFNPLDLLMAVRGISFLDAAGLLSKVLHSRQQALATDCSDRGIPKCSTRGPQLVGELLAALAATAERGQNGR